MATSSSTVRIKAQDGEMTGFLARPSADGKYPAVLVIMEAFGLTDHMKSVATRIAGEGYVALAPDMYYRQPNAVVGYDQLADAIQLMTTLRDASIRRPAPRRSRICRANLSSAPIASASPLLHGRRISYLAACSLPAIKAAGRRSTAASMAARSRRRHHLSDALLRRPGCVHPERRGRQDRSGRWPT
jgi:hypothetical protein